MFHGSETDDPFTYSNKCHRSDIVDLFIVTSMFHGSATIDPLTYSDRFETPSHYNGK